MQHLTPRILAAVTIAALAWPGMASAQSLGERIEAVQQRRADDAAGAARERAEALRDVERRLASPMRVSMDRRPVREAFAAWSDLTGVALVVDWRAMEIDGVDADRPVTLDLADVSAGGVLLLMMDAASDEQRFIAEVELYGLRVRTRERANRDVVTRVYDVRDLVMEVPTFDDAPSLDLTDALSNTSTGGEGRSGGGGVFAEDDAAAEPTTKQERGEALAEAVRDTVEPDVWRENGGEYSTLRYRGGMLIVRAPAYVHVQIGRGAVMGGRNGR